MVERSEPSFMPGWLKGSSGGGLTSTQHFQDEGGNSRNKVAQLAVGNHSDLPRGLGASDRVFSPSARRGHTNSSVERPSLERDHFSSLRLQSSLNRSSSCRSYDLPNWDRDSSNHEYERDADRDILSRRKDWLLGTPSDEREKEREYVENGMQRLLNTGKYDAEMKLKRSQSQSPRLSERSLFKGTDAISTLPSAPGGLATSMQKAVFERNFPSLGTDEKQNSSLFNSGNSLIASPRPSTGSPRPLWQGTRPDLTRASSPGLAGSFGYPMGVSMPINGDVWSSALAEVPLPNGNTHGSTVAVSAGPFTSSSHTSVSAAPVVATPAAPLNMAEALTQNPPRARTPLQISIESQRLEELALKQSRQLIPMMPTLPKTMSLVDKTKSKTPRAADVASSKAAQQLNSQQLNKPLTPARPDTPKHSQGKLIVLRSGKDGSTTMKSDGANISTNTQGSTGPAASASSAINGVGNSGMGGHRKPEESRVKGPTLLVDDKRPSQQAQNRSDFFNALRKKAAGNGNSSNVLNSSKSNVQSSQEIALNSEANLVNQESSMTSTKDSKSEIHSNGVVKHDLGNGLAENSITKTEGGHCNLPRDSEEEEAAFMRSLGWEENAECSELTEEEINAFYHQLKEREKHISISGKHSLRALSVGNFVGSVGSLSSGLSSSDSETDEEPSYSMQVALSNTVH